jgi:hypothetical protein
MIIMSRQARSVAEPMRVAWLVLVPGWPPFPMVGAACTRAQALETVRLIWAKAEIGDY